MTLFALGVMPSGQHTVLVLIFALFTLTLSAISNLVGVFPAKSFPTEVRYSGIGFATSMSRLGSVISTFILPGFMAAHGAGTTMVVLSTVLLGGTIVSIVWATETKTLTLAQASRVK